MIIQKKNMTFFIFIFALQQIISSCAIAPSHGIINEDDGLRDLYVFQDKCSQCHELPDIEAYPYSSDDWVKIVDYMLETKEADQLISLEETKKIKRFLGTYSITRQLPGKIDE